MDQRVGTFYFQRSNGERVLLAKNINKNDVFIVMKQFLDNHKCKTYYIRTCESENELWIDVGSWSEFFILAYKEDDMKNEKELEYKN